LALGGEKFGEGVGVGRDQPERSTTFIENGTGTGWLFNALEARLKGFGLVFTEAKIEKGKTKKGKLCEKRNL